MTTHTHPTLLIPGFAGGNTPFKPFRDELRSRLIDAECWPKSPFVYRRRIEAHGRRLAHSILMHEAHDLTLVGWSEGGLVAVSAMRDPDVAAKVRRVITYASPFDGTWVAYLGYLMDHLLFLKVREMAPRSRVLTELVEFLHRPRDWDFHAVSGTKDLLVPGRPKRLDPAWCHVGPWNHHSPIWDPSLLEVIHRLILLP